MDNKDEALQDIVQTIVIIKITTMNMMIETPVGTHPKWGQPIEVVHHLHAGKLMTRIGVSGGPHVGAPW